MTAPQLLSGGQERHDGAWGGCLAPGVAASCLPGVANFPTSSFQPSNGHPETSFRPILAREGAFEMGSGQSSCQHRPLRLRASRFGRSVNFPWTLGAAEGQPPPPQSTPARKQPRPHDPRPIRKLPGGPAGWAFRKLSSQFLFQAPGLSLARAQSGASHTPPAQHWNVYPL